MRMMSVTKRFEFDYAHFLPNHPGKCKNLHGHRGVAEVEVGTIAYNPEYDPFGNGVGMVIDFGSIKESIEANILPYLDHHLLNDTNIIPPQYQPPTAENIARFIWDKAEAIIPLNHGKTNIIRVRVYETPNSYAELKRC